MNEKIDIHKFNLQNVLDKMKEWNIPKSVKEDLIKFCEDMKLGKVSRGKKSHDKSVIKSLYILRTPLEFFNKPLEKVDIKDIEKFEKSLDLNKVISSHKKQYSISMKVAFKKTLKSFFRWKLGEKEALDLVGWLDCRQKARTPDALSELEIEKIYRSCKNAQERYLIAVLFDTGARIEEFSNIRKEDIRFPEGKDNFVKIELKDEYSKTEGRVVTLFWKYSLDAVKEYFEERVREGLEKDEQIFKKNYPATRLFLKRFGKKVLNRSIHPHLFRHTSATYYAAKMNRQQLCIRYGWKFSSGMPDVYIKRSGVDMKELEEKFTGTEISELQTKILKLEQDNKIKEEELKKYIDTLFKHLVENNNFGKGVHVIDDSNTMF